MQKNEILRHLEELPAGQIYYVSPKLYFIRGFEYYRDRRCGCTAEHCAGADSETRSGRSEQVKINLSPICGRVNKTGTRKLGVVMDVVLTMYAPDVFCSNT